MQRGLGLVGRLVLGAGVLAWGMAATQAPRKPTAKSAELETAVAELKREYAAHSKDPDRAPLRKACDYFADQVMPVPLDALLAALDKPLPGAGASDGRLCAYVKWQLLSALPAELDESAVQQLVKIYDRAPLPSPRYGSSPKEKRQLDTLLTGARPQDDVPLTNKLSEAVERAFTADVPIVTYRDELYRRLPIGREKFLAGMRDASARLGVAAQKDALAEMLQADLPKWAGVAGTERAQVREVAEAFGKLRFVESPPYYGSAGVRRGKLTWVTATDTLSTKRKLSTLHKLLLDAAGVAAAPPVDGVARKSTRR